MSEVRSTRQPRPTRPIRSARARIKTYHEDSSSTEEPESPPELNASRPSTQNVSLRPRNISGKRQFYHEESSSENSGLLSSSDENPSRHIDEPVHATSNGRGTLSTSAVSAASATSSTGRVVVNDPHSEHSRPSKPTQAKRNTTTKNRSKMKVTPKSSKKRARVIADDIVDTASGVVPPWSTLPYHILLDIFIRASHPLVDEQLMQRTKSAKWLLEIALLCRSFLEPALAALLHSPPLVPTSKSFELLDLLSRPQASTAINYPTKVKQLHVDAESVLLYKAGPQLGWFELSQLLARVPQVNTVRLFHKDDFTIGLPHYSIRLSKWNYPESLFSTMDENGIGLHQWDWNGRFMEDTELFPFMLEKHQRAAFQQLRHLRLIHIGISSFTDAEQTNATLAEAVGQLQHIEELELIECPLVDGRCLSQLPKTLQSLTIINCDSIFSSSIEDFLKSCGQQLRQLNLRHNRHLNLSFVTNLAKYCPSLQRFKMDISMHDWSSYHDSEPHFKELLAEDETPTWPETLRELELIQMKKLSDSTAESFFMSLVDAAPKMPDLRRLTITAILKIGWRDRANFREKWIRQVEDTFKRCSDPPNPNYRSLRKRKINPAPPESAAEPARPTSAGSGHSATSKRQSTRLARQKDAAPCSPQPLTHHHVRQGMCDVVNIRIDNLRPMETQFNEADFLDDELSGDEDWAGDDWQPAERHAW